MVFVPLVLASSLLMGLPPDTTLEARLGAWRGMHQDRILGELIDFLSVPNVASDHLGIRRNADMLESMLQRRGFAVERWTAVGASPILFGTLTVDTLLPTITFYAHYDGQPVSPEEWTSPPWVPILRDSSGGTVSRRVAARIPSTRIHARSASDDKAPIVALLTALDAVSALGERPTVNVRFFLEGEEEAGSPHLAELLAPHRERLASDVWVFLDGPMHQSGAPQVILGVRGFLSLRLTTYGPSRPLHSGHYGNWAANPTATLVSLLASMRDDDARILIDGFDSTWAEPTSADLAASRDLPRIDRRLREELALGRTEGSDAPLAVQVLAPAMNIVGFDGGPTDGGAANRIPASASAVVDFRLVSGQEPSELREHVEAHARARGFRIITGVPDSATRRNTLRLLRLEWGVGYPGARTPTDAPMVAALLGVLERGFGRRPLVVPTLGGSLPITMLVHAPDSPFLILPLVNSDNRQHAADENLRLGNLWAGIDMLGSLLVRAGPAMRELGEVSE